jgi:9-cis-epoxycarotenoid dioxygenase
MNLEPVSTEQTLEIPFNTPPKLIGITYLRNGANAYLPYDKNHLFDGDGMIHLFKFQKDKIIYSNRWIRTYRFRTERKYNSPLFLRLGNFSTTEILTKILSRLVRNEDIFSVYGEGTANTNVVVHAGKILALNEMDKPYLLILTKRGFKTVERYDFNGKLDYNMNAHPKIDPTTGEMVALGYDVLRSNCCLFFINALGDITKKMFIPLSRSTIIHDIGITSTKILIPDFPLEFRFFAPFPLCVSRGSRIGIVNRKNGQLQWIPLPQDEIVFHIAKTCENNNTIDMYAFLYNPVTFDIQQLHLQRPVLKKISLDLLKKSAVVSTVNDLPVGELPVEDPGDKDVFYYSRISDNGFDAIVKYNVATGEKNIRPFGEGLYGGESAVYDQYLLNVVYVKREHVSRLMIFLKDSLELVASVDLGVRIPFGFHGCIHSG